MKGYRNLLLVGLTLVCETFLVAKGIEYQSDLVGLASVLGIVGGTAVGGAVARGYNKKHAPEQ